MLEHRRRADRALASVVATSYLLGVSTRRVEKLAGSLGVVGLSRSQVSAMTAELDELMEGFRNRPLDRGPYTFVQLDALNWKVESSPPAAKGDSPRRERMRHSARNTCGSLLAALDVHPRVAMQILRHSRVAITMEIYTEVPSAATREALSPTWRTPSQAATFRSLRRL